MKKFTSLAEIRQEIDQIDLELLALLQRRSQCSLQVADIKQAEAAELTDATIPSDTSASRPDYYRPEREAQIMRKMSSLNEGPIDDESVVRIYREIISSSLALEEPMRIAYLGPEGTFTHAATLKHFGSAVITDPCTGIDEIFRATESGQTRFGVVPIENSTEGMINHTLDRIAESRLRICGECRLRIEHNLLSNAESLASVTAVHAHSQALAQCRNWLDQHMPNAERVSEASNAAAAEKVAIQLGAAAIAGKAAASLYGLRVLEHNIEDIPNNTTRFFVVGDRDIPISGDDATSLLISAPHKPGGLRKMLEPLEKAGVSMTRIESRPSRTNLWEYNFFIDVSGHQHDDLLQGVLEELKHEAQYLRVLGSYPKSL